MAVRGRTCFGINRGPRVHEMNRADIIDSMLIAGAEVFDAGNLRHQHLGKSLKNVALSEGRFILPRVLSFFTPQNEHSERFPSFAAIKEEIRPRIVGGRIVNLADGGRIASGELWS